MFEGSLVESRVGTGTARWTALGSITLQCAVAALLVAIPLLHPEALPRLSDAPKLTVPLPPRPPVPEVRMEAAASSTAAVSLPAVMSAIETTRRFVFPARSDAAEMGPLPGSISTLRMGDGSSGPLAGLGVGDTAPTVTVVKAKPPGPVRVSSGVSSGMLLNELRPVYPAIAKAARVEGAVVMEAVISKAGRIESLHVVSGPEMLRRAALDAVQGARYEPYRLNGEATEVQTTITVNFRLN